MSVEDSICLERSQIMEFVFGTDCVGKADEQIIRQSSIFGAILA